MFWHRTFPGTSGFLTRVNFGFPKKSVFVFVRNCLPVFGLITLHLLMEHCFAADSKAVRVAGGLGSGQTCLCKKSGWGQSPNGSVVVVVLVVVVRGVVVVVVLVVVVRGVVVVVVLVVVVRCVVVVVVFVVVVREVVEAAGARWWGTSWTVPSLRSLLAVSLWYKRFYKKSISWSFLWCYVKRSNEDVRPNGLKV